MQGAHGGKTMQLACLLAWIGGDAIPDVPKRWSRASLAFVVANLLPKDATQCFFASANSHAPTRRSRGTHPADERKKRVYFIPTSKAGKSHRW